MINAVDFNFIKNLISVLQGLGNVGKHLVHLFLRLEPLLLAVEHQILIGEFPACGEADESFMSIGILLIHKVRIVGADELDVQLLGKLYERIIHQTLLLIGLVIGTSDSGLVALQLQIIVITEQVFEPLDGLTGLIHLPTHDELWHFTAQACRTADNTFVIFLKLTMIGTRMGVEPLGPSVRHDLDEVLVTLQVLGQQNQVISDVALVKVLVTVLLGDIYLTAEDGLEFLVITTFLVQLGDIIVKFLDAIHVAVIGYCHATHPVTYCFVNKRLDGCHAVKDGIL